MAIDDSGPASFAPIDSFSSDPSIAVGTINQTYANLDQAGVIIAQAINVNTQLMTDLQTDLSGYKLVVTTDSMDALLSQAISVMWPENLGAPESYVSYSYYRYLKDLNSSAATFICDKYEEGIRGETGSSSLDFLILVNIILNELTLCQVFVANYDGNLSDSSEHRAIENIQDFAQSALVHAGRLRALFTATNAARTFTTAEIATINSRDAYNAQAIFKVNLNKINKDIAYITEFLQKEFKVYASTFYNNFLGPALAFHLLISNSISPILPGLIGKEVNAAKTSTDKDLAMILTDQTRRMQVFELKIQELEVQIQMRDTYRSYIQQLAQKGAPIPVGLSGTMTKAASNATADSWFDQMATQAPISPDFTSPHNALSDLLNPLSHPQYLLKHGDTLTGPIAMTTTSTIDGIHPSTHRHTGSDGSTQVNGADILGGTLTAAAVNTTSGPTIPENLRIVSQSIRSISPSTQVVDVVIAWDSEDGNTFDVQIAPIT